MICEGSGRSEWVGVMEFYNLLKYKEEEILWVEMLHNDF